MELKLQNKNRFKDWNWYYPEINNDAMAKYLIIILRTQIKQDYVL